MVLDAATLSEGAWVRSSAASTAQAEPLLVELIKPSDELSHIIQIGLNVIKVVGGRMVILR